MCVKINEMARIKIITEYNKVCEMVLLWTLQTNLIKFMCVRVIKMRKNWGTELEDKVKEE